MHGLAGSGALTALVLATLPTTAARITYMALFGLGSSLGMAALSGLLGWPLARLGGEARTMRTVSMIVGCVSTALGVAWGLPILPRLFNPSEIVRLKPDTTRDCSTGTLHLHLHPHLSTCT